MCDRRRVARGSRRAGNGIRERGSLNPWQAQACCYKMSIAQQKTGEQGSTADCEYGLPVSRRTAYSGRARCVFLVASIVLLCSLCSLYSPGCTHLQVTRSNSHSPVLWHLGAHLSQISQTHVNRQQCNAHVLMCSQKKRRAVVCIVYESSVLLHIFQTNPWQGNYMTVN